MTTFRVYSDPGHGWLKVSARQLEMAGLSEKNISVFSFKRGTKYFLEEDSDASLFLTSWAKTVKKPYKFKESNSNKRSKIRNYESVNHHG